MRMVIKKLKKEDVERYGTGRREMRVVMETASEEEMDDDVQGSDHEGDTSSEDENGL